MDSLHLTHLWPQKCSSRLLCRLVSMQICPLLYHDQQSSTLQHCSLSCLFWNVVSWGKKLSPLPILLIPQGSLLEILQYLNQRIWCNNFLKCIVSINQNDINYGNVEMFGPLKQIIVWLDSFLPSPSLTAIYQCAY